MAILYVRNTDGSDSDNGSTWALAKQTLAGAFAAASAGDTIYVSDNHAESQSSAMTLTSPGTAASPVKVICVDDSAEPPTAVATTGSITTTAASSITFTGHAYCYGIAFNCGTGASAAHIQFGSAATEWVLEECSLNLLTSSGSSQMFVLATNFLGVYLRNTSLRFGSTSQNIEQRGGVIDWRGGSVNSAGSAPDTLFIRGDSRPYTFIRGVDLSHLGSGKTLFVATGDSGREAMLENCKLGSSVTIYSGSFIGPRVGAIELINCNAGDVNYDYYKAGYTGITTMEGTIVRTGGASDGTKSVSRKMVSNASTNFGQPLVLDSIAIWNETTGSSVTVTAETVTDNVTLKDNEAWLEIEGLATSGFPQSTFSNDRSTPVASGANQTTSSETWTTTGLGTPVKQKLAVTFTPQEKGPIRARVMLAKASTTMYVCPKIDIT